MNAGIVGQGASPIGMPQPLLGRPTPVPVPLGSGCDPFWANVTLLCHFDGGVNGTSFVDSSSLRNTFTPANTPRTTNVARVFGQTSGLFASSAYLDVASGAQSCAFGTANFTVEFWFQTTSLSVQNSLFDTRPNTTNTTQLYVAVKTTGALFAFINGSDRIVSSAGAVVVGNWYHVAVSRVASQTRMFLNGTQVGATYADTTNYTQPSTRQCRIASAGYFAAGGEPLVGYMDELRVTKGVGRYVAPFRPSEAAFPEC